MRLRFLKNGNIKVWYVLMDWYSSTENPKHRLKINSPKAEHSTCVPENNIYYWNENKMSDSAPF